jgi:hypothetical protein
MRGELVAGAGLPAVGFSGTRNGSAPCHYRRAARTVNEARTNQPPKWFTSRPRRRPERRRPVQLRARELTNSASAMRSFFMVMGIGRTIR